MKIDALTAILASLFVLVIALFIYSVIDSVIDTRRALAEFSEVCTQAGGVTVYNGRHYECIIKAVR